MEPNPSGKTMDGGDSDMPSSKRPCLVPVNFLPSNRLPPISSIHLSQPQLHPASLKTFSPPLPRHYPDPRAARASSPSQNFYPPAPVQASFPSIFHHYQHPTPVPAQTSSSPSRRLYQHPTPAQVQVSSHPVPHHYQHPASSQTQTSSPPLFHHYQHPTPAPAQDSAPPSLYHHPPLTQPPPLEPLSLGPRHHHGPLPPHPSSSLPPSDARNLANPTNIPHRAYDVPLDTSTPDKDSNPAADLPTKPQYPGAPKRSAPVSTSSNEKETKPPMAHGGPPTSRHVNQDYRNVTGKSSGCPPTVIWSELNLPSQLFQPTQSSTDSDDMPAQSSAGGGDIPAQSSAGRGYKPVQSFAGGGYRTAQSSADNGYRPALQGPGLVGRRQIRATQACNHCRLRKQRCDEARPCQLCRDNALDCQYKEVPMPKQDVKMMQLQNSVNGISDTLNGFIHRWEMATETRQPLTNSHDVMATAKDHPAPPERFRSSRSRTVGQHPGAIQSDHNTSAHKLLPQWSLAFKLEETVPALKHLVDSGENFIEYPLYYERKRGNLRVWGFGQGDDIFDFIGSLDNLDSNSGPPSPKVPIATGFKYGCPPVNHSSSSTMNGDIPRNQESVGLGSDGKADFRLSTLNSLRKSYQKHIHILHPILDLNELEDMIDSFGKTYGPNAKASYTMSYDRDSVAHKLSRGSIERSIGNAIVLLVLALGTVSEHKGNLPSPIESSSYSEAYDTHSRNIDILPGFIYFAHATDILGHQQSGNTVAHVQAMILAALYLAQLGRVMESWNWISNACRATLVLLHAYYPRINRQMKDQQIDGRPVIPEKDPHQLNILSIVYWSCLSLETDILAEWSKLPASMVSTYQGDVKSPWAVFEHAFHIPATTDDDPPGTALSIFSNLADLRVLLNGAHNDLYKVDSEESTAAILKKSDSLTQLLREWRNALDPSLAWNDEDPPSTDVNTARLRAKMYGAKYVILRPYLYETIKKYENLYTFKEQMQHPELIEASKDCILSAIQSTIAFDRVGADPASPYENYVSTRTRRLILTNVVGTLHAQFGNMVVLAAAWISPLMNHLPRGTLDNEAMSLLFYRTMNILSEMAPNSPILQVDYDILSEIKHQLQLKSYQS